MSQTAPLTPLEIRQARKNNPKLRDRDFAAEFQISEAQLVAAFVGTEATCISADIDKIFPRLATLGEVMALTRNNSCVIEKVGSYANFHAGKHAAMVLTEEIDLRLFPRHFVSAFAVEREGASGIRRSLQFFDAAGDAVHKIHLRPESNLDTWQTLVDELTLAEQNDSLEVSPRIPPEVAKGSPEKAAELRRDWEAMTDTHQFRSMTSRLKMNRLGAYRIVGEPLARALAPEAIDDALQALCGSGTEVMIFVGNMGCIEIHGGPVQNLRAMGPWQNILDPGFDLHLRLDHIAEVWAVTKPTRDGNTQSIEAFDAEGGLILQIFGRRTKAQDHRPEWHAIITQLPSLASNSPTKSSEMEAAE